MRLNSILKSKTLKVIFLLLFITKLYVYSQNDSIYRAIASYQDTTSQFIGKARGMLLNRFSEQDLKTTSDLKKVLQKIENEDYITLYPIERWLLDYNLNDYSDVLITTLQFDSVYYASFNYRVRPPDNVLEMNLSSFSSENLLKLEMSIDNSLLETEEKEFLKLNLHFLLSLKKQDHDRDTLNEMANSFIQAFPQSKYIGYTKRYIRYQFGPSDFGFGLNVGLGIRMNSGAIRNTIDEGILLDFGMVFTYKRWDYNLNILIGPVQLQKDLPVKDKTWLKGTDANYLNCEFSVARNMLNSKRHKLSPSLGIAITEFSPYQETIDKDPSFKDVKVDLGNIVFGINYQYKYPMKRHAHYSGFQNYFGGLNLRYALSKQVTNDKLYQGFTNYITLTWQFEMHGVKRDL